MRTSRLYTSSQTPIKKRERLDTWTVHNCAAVSAAGRTCRQHSRAYLVTSCKGLSMSHVFLCTLLFKHFQGLAFPWNTQEFQGTCEPWKKWPRTRCPFWSFQGYCTPLYKTTQPLCTTHFVNVFRVTISPLCRCNLPHAALKIQFWKKEPLWDIRLSMFCQLAFSLLRPSCVAVFVAVVSYGLLPKCWSISWNYC